MIRQTHPVTRNLLTGSALLLRNARTALIVLFLVGCGENISGPEPLADQKALSKIAKSRHYTISVYHEGQAEIDGQRVHVFAEQAVSKFGGSNTRLFTLPVSALELKTDVGDYAGPGALRHEYDFSYNHDEGVFELRTTRGRYKLPYELVETIEADFDEKFTLREERCITQRAGAEEKPNDFQQVLNAAQACFLAGYYGDSLRFTQQLKDNWGSFGRYTTAGGMLNEYHTLMGRHALREERIREAVGHLSKSVDVKQPSATMVSFGPNTTLARELLQQGENEAVLAYLDRIAEFWKTEPVQIWKGKINRGRTPALNIHNWEEELQAADYRVNESTLAREQVLEVLNGNTVSGFYDNKGWDIRFNLFFGPDGMARFGDRYGSSTAPWAIRDDGCMEVKMRWNRLGKCQYLEAGEHNGLMLYPGVYSNATKLVLLEGEREYAESACARDFRNQEFGKALESCLAEAESNDIQAQNLLGVIHEFHMGDRTDYQEAMRWYQLAADQGERFAPFNLAQLYRTGRAGVRDLAKAVEHYSMSAERGYGEAQFSLGVMYFEGSGTAVDMKMAKYWWEQARSNGVARAEEALGRIP
jgi:TPR repeat protein